MAHARLRRDRALMNRLLSPHRNLARALGMPSLERPLLSSFFAASDEVIERRACLHVSPWAKRYIRFRRPCPSAYVPAAAREGFEFAGCRPRWLLGASCALCTCGAPSLSSRILRPVFFLSIGLRLFAQLASARKPATTMAGASPFDFQCFRWCKEVPASAERRSAFSVFLLRRSRRKVLPPTSAAGAGGRSSAPAALASCLLASGSPAFRSPLALALPPHARRSRIAAGVGALHAQPARHERDGEESEREQQEHAHVAEDRRERFGRGSL